MCSAIVVITRYLIVRSVVFSESDSMDYCNVDRPDNILFESVKYSITDDRFFAYFPYCLNLWWFSVDSVLGLHLKKKKIEKGKSSSERFWVHADGQALSFDCIRLLDSHRRLCFIGVALIRGTLKTLRVVAVRRSTV